MIRRPITSPLARPGRKYISGIIYLSAVILIALLFVGARWLLGR